MIKLVLFLMSLMISVMLFAQDDSLVTTSNMMNIEYDIQGNQIDTYYIYDTTSTFKIDFGDFKIYINDDVYEISEYAVNQHYSMYVILVKLPDGRFINVLYYYNQEMILVKYLVEHNVTWYYE